MIKDSDFIQGFAPSLTDDYLKAKSYVQDVPTQALLHVRSFTHKLTVFLADNLAPAAAISFTSPNLYDRIEQLNQLRIIDVKTTRALHKLRAEGNRGAHPEKYHLTEDQLLALAQKAIKDVLNVVEHLYTPVTGRAAPLYRYEACDSVNTKDLCYRAVMEDDAEAQYLVGISLKTKALMLKESALSEPELSVDKAADSEALSAETSFERAAYWFALAAPRNMHAMYEHGVALIHGYHGAPNKTQGEQAIATAAKAGVINAMALIGYFYLVGSATCSADLALAQPFLQQAADGEQVEAMANLGVLHYQRQDFEQAYHFISKAAQAGYPHAQYHLALMLANGDGCQANAIKSEHWLAEAAEQGQVDAMLLRAQHMLNDDNALTSELTQAEAYLRSAIKYGHSVPAMIELSMALADGILGRIDVVDAAALLRKARQLAKPQEAEIIKPLWQSLSMQVDNVLRVTQKADERHSLTRAQTLLDWEVEQ